jgi:hypothetical protein
MFVSNFSLEGYQIFWSTKIGISRRERQLLVKSLIEMTRVIGKSMDFTKEEELNDRLAEIRLHVISKSNKKVYLVIENCTNARHLFLETNKVIVGEIAHPGEPFMRMLDDKDVAVETLCVK